MFNVENVASLTCYCSGIWVSQNLEWYGVVQGIFGARVDEEVDCDIRVLKNSRKFGSYLII